MDTELDAVEKLKDILRSMPQSDHATLDFSFVTNAVSEIGVGEQWIASIRSLKIVTQVYGWTLQEAAERLLDLFLHPEKYPNVD
jgi:hypothetical protein